MPIINQTYFHVAAYRKSVTNGVANDPLTVVNDQILTPNSTTSFLVPERLRLFMAVIKSASVTRGRINTPALRYIGLPDIAPADVGLTVASPPNVAVWGPMGVELPPADAIAVEGTHGGGAAEVMAACVWLWKPGRTKVPGPVYRTRWTAAITGVAGSWVNGALTPDSTLPAGIYEIQGMDCQSANGIAARLAFPGGGYRPGCLVRNALTSIRFPDYQNGELGPYGQFDSVNPPTLDIYGEGASSAQVVWLDVVRIGDR